MPIFVEEQRPDAYQNKNAVRGQPPRILKRTVRDEESRAINALTPRASISEKRKKKKQSRLHNPRPSAERMLLALALVACTSHILRGAERLGVRDMLGI
jgi:hypothetical protein